MGYGCTYGIVCEFYVALTLSSHPRRSSVFVENKSQMAEFGIVEKLAPLVPPPPQTVPASNGTASKKSAAAATTAITASSEEEAQFLAVVHREPDLTNIILRLLFNLSFDLTLRSRSSPLSSPPCVF